jgi:hypothetical protein
VALLAAKALQLSELRIRYLVKVDVTSAGPNHPVYAYLASTIAAVFFPQQDRTAGLCRFSRCSRCRSASDPSGQGPRTGVRVVSTCWLPRHHAPLHCLLSGVGHQFGRDPTSTTTGSVSRLVAPIPKQTADSTAALDHKFTSQTPRDDHRARRTTRVT